MPCQHGVVPKNNVVSIRRCATAMPCQNCVVSRRCRRYNRVPCQYGAMPRRRHVNLTMFQNDVKSKMASYHFDFVSTRRRANTVYIETNSCQHDTASRRRLVNTTSCQCDVVSQRWCVNTAMCQDDAVPRRRRVKTMSCQHNVLSRRHRSTHGIV